MKRAFTLIELLVVIAIIGAVTIATVPMLLPALDVRRIREASRIVTTQIASAQSEALANGRPAGLWIERLKGEPTAAMDLFLCDVPAPYAGDLGSVAKAYDNGTEYTFQILDNTGAAAAAEYGLTAKLISAGDLIQFNYRGPWFRIADQTKNDLDPVDGVPTIVKASNNNRTTPHNGIVIEAADVNSKLPQTGNGVPFKILRRPIKNGSPIQMPSGACLDLYYSGSNSVNASGYFGTAASGPIVVTFKKTGELDRFQVGGILYNATSPIYFLVGKRSKLPAQSFVSTEDEATQSDKHNFRDLENIWIAINPQTGLVTTAECAAQATPAPTLIDDQIKASRAFAASAQAMGGR